MASTTETNKIIPLCYALLPDKKQNTYEILFEMIKSQIPELQPKSFTSDYEASAMLAVKNCFPTVTIRGCFFHFSRACWRKADNLGLKKCRFAKAHIRRAVSLAYLPKEFVTDGWLYVKGEGGTDSKICQFNEYFEQTWIRASSLLFDKWCFHNIRHKTNNANETWNGRLNKKISSKPNIATLLKLLEKNSNYYFGLMKQKGFISKRTYQTMQIQKKIERCTRELCDSEISVGHCIEKLSNI